MKNAWYCAYFVFAACQTSPHPRATQAASAAPVASASPVDELDRLDQRRPLPLLPMMAHHQKQNMREHLVAVQEVVAAAAARDFGKVAEAARRIGSSEAMGQMCEHLGAGAPGFTEQALAFHRTADGIADAAHQGNAEAVLAALASTLAACTACHATYKQRPVASLGD